MAGIVTAVVGALCRGGDVVTGAAVVAGEAVVAGVTGGRETETGVVGSDDSGAWVDGVEADTGSPEAGV